ncbi:MAG: hypothetical protein K6T66_05835 [Peptococcaceae bacterium]|nr:hypothetical protein [Peptococcaceae bacterium]
MRTKCIIAAWLLVTVLILSGCASNAENVKTSAAGSPLQENHPTQSPAPSSPPPQAGQEPKDGSAKETRPVTVLDPLPDLVAAETVEIRGKTQPGSKVFINGQEAPLDNGGGFNFPFSLQVGKNEIKVVTLGREKIEDSRTIAIERRPLPPKLTVISPERSDTENLAISGQTERGCIVYVNTSLARPDREGNFSSTVQLKEGVNDIKITSTNRDGGTATVQKTVTFTPPNPKLEVIVPQDTRSNQVTISGITDTNTVLVLYVNDVRSNINLQKGIFSATITLVEGVNTVTITAVNKWGKTSTIRRDIIYTAP